MADISNASWSETDASNNAVSPNGWTPGTMLPSDVEPVGQMMMGAIKRSWDRANAQVTTTGSSGTYVYTPTNPAYPASIIPGEIFGFVAHQASAGNDTFTINGTVVLGPYNLYVATQAGGIRQIKAGEIVLNQMCAVQYSTAAGGMVLHAVAQPYGDGQKYVVAGGSADVWTAAVSVTSLFDGMELLVKFPQANATSTPTINVNGLGAKVIGGDAGATINPGDIAAGSVRAITYDAAVGKFAVFLGNSVASAQVSATAAHADRLAADADAAAAHADRLAADSDAAAAHTDRVAADTDAANALSYSNAAAASAASAGAYPNAAASNVPQGLTQSSVGTITGGSGGTNGTFNLSWSGGNFSINPTGMFTVSGGAVTAVTITGPGQYIGSSPTIPTPSFAASSGLTGAAVVLTIQYLVASGNGYWVQSSDGASLIRYKNSSGTATLDSSVTPIPSYQANTAPRLSRTVDSVQGNDGSFIAGTRADGLRVRWNNPSGRRVYTRYIAGKSQVFIADQYGESQLTYTGNNSAPEICVSQILFTSDRRGYPEPYFMGLDGTNQTPAATQLTEHWTCTGQSLMSGDQATTALSTVNVDSRAQMLSLNLTAGTYGPRTHIDSNPPAIDGTFDITKSTGLTALVEAAIVPGNRGETICSGFAAQYLKGQPATEKIVIDNHARGSATYTNDGTDPWLAPSSVHFTNGLVFQELVRKYVEAGGGAYRYAGMLNIHGHAAAFIGTSRASYLAQVQDWRNSYNQQTRTRSTLHRQQPMFISQMSNLGYSPTLQNNLNIAFAQMDAHQAKTGVFLIGAAYLFNTVDGTHLTAAGNRQHGEYFGKVVRRVMKEGVAWEPLYPKSWTRSGSVINIVFNVPVAPLVFDTSIVSDPGNGGFTYIADTADGISVSSVALGSDGVSVNVTLSGTAFGTNPRFRIAGTQTGSNAGPTTGARSTLRDSDNEKGVLSGLPLYNYACIFEGAIV